MFYFFVNLILLQQSNRADSCQISQRALMTKIKCIKYLSCCFKYNFKTLHVALNTILNFTRNVFLCLKQRRLFIQSVIFSQLIVFQSTVLPGRFAFESGKLVRGDRNVLGRQAAAETLGMNRISGLAGYPVSGRMVVLDIGQQLSILY